MNDKEYQRPRNWTAHISGLLLLAIGWVVALFSDGLLPEMPRSARVCYLTAISVLGLWLMYVRSDYYDAKKSERNGWLLIAVICIVIIAAARGVAIVSSVPTANERLKERVRTWVANIDSDYREAKPHKGDLFQFDFKIPRVGTPESPQFPAHTVLNIKSQQLMVGIKLIDPTYTEFADCLHVSLQNQLKREISDLLNTLAETQDTFNRHPPDPFTLMSVVELDPESATRTDFTYALNQVLSSMRRRTALMRDQMRKYATYTIAGKTPQICTTRPCECKDQ